jgi:peptide deformylase
MAILKVAQLGHPVLRKVSELVGMEELQGQEFQRFCDDLLETMVAYDGLGLAAPQVHVSKRVVVFQLDEETGPLFLVNPIVTALTDTKKAGYEGCLSVTNMRGRVERAASVRVSCLDRHGQELEFVAHGWAARVVQHECDHLNGVLYVDKADPRSLAFLPEYRRYGGLVPVGDEEEEDELEGDETEE